MNLTEITPLVLTYNEARNIEACLDSLRWARKVVVVDSHSLDDTLGLVAKFSNARAVLRTFDSHANQWNFAVEQSGADAEWLLAMDADHRVTPELLEEIRESSPSSSVSAFEIAFRYCIYGRPLRGALYRPAKALFRKSRCRYRQDGHTQRLELLSGDVVRLRNFLLHDDRKALGRWLESQAHYADLEVEKLRSIPGDQIGVPDRLRKAILPAPFAAFFYALFVKGAALDGWPGWFYALQRLTAELLLSMKLLEGRLSATEGRASPPSA